MHELGYVDAIIRIVKDRLRLNNVEGKVLNIRVCVAKLTEVSEENLKMWFDQLTKNTPLEDTQLIIKEIQMPAGLPAGQAGKNFFVESIEVE